MLQTIKSLATSKRFKILLQKGFLEEAKHEAIILIQSRWRIKKARRIVAIQRQRRHEEEQHRRRAKAFARLSQFFLLVKAKFERIRRKKACACVVLVELKSASDLPAGDSNGLSDPFVYIQGWKGLSSKSSESLSTGEIQAKSKNLYKSEAKLKTLNPVWNEACYLPFMRSSDSIVLTIVDQDVLTANSILGQVSRRVRMMLIMHDRHD